MSLNLAMHAVATVLYSTGVLGGGNSEVGLLLPGVIVGVRGEEPEEDRGRFHVEEYCCLDVTAQPPRPTLDTDWWVALHSRGDPCQKDWYIWPGVTAQPGWPLSEKDWYVSPGVTAQSGWLLSEKDWYVWPVVTAQPGWHLWENDKYYVWPSVTAQSGWPQWGDRYVDWVDCTIIVTPVRERSDLLTSLTRCGCTAGVTHGREEQVWPGPVFCLLLGVSSDYAQPITGQVTEVTCPVIGRAQPELTPS